MSDKAYAMFFVSRIIPLLVCCFRIVFSGGNLWSNTEHNAEGHFIVEPMIEHSWVSDSRLNCVRDCHATSQNCKAVTFNESTGVCAPIGRIRKLRGVPTTTNQSVHAYYSDEASICDETNGFTFVTKNNVSVCIYVSDEYVPYEEATQRCEQMRGVIYTMKNIERFEIAREYTNHVNCTWIGLTSPYRNGSFYWPDGERFDELSTLWSSLWDVAGGQPNIHSSAVEEYCTLSYCRFADCKLNDAPCEMPSRYICERRPDFYA